MKNYDSEFYNNINEGSLKAARIIVPLIIDLFSPKSVVDFGCGTGSWLSVFKNNNIPNIIGLDFGSLTHDQFETPKNSFMKVDLSEYIDLNQRYDIALCLEVAEHLPENKSRNLIGNLIRHSDIIIFSAAIPGQHGRNHLNCQYPSYWKNIFSQHMYLCFDPFRKLIWNDSSIPFWYRQNILVYVSRKVIGEYSILDNYICSDNDLVHPAMLKHVIDNYKNRLSEIHATYKEQIKNAKKEIWAKATNS